MKIFITIFFLNILFAEAINQKMIISTDVETEKAAQVMHELKMFFQENNTAKELKAKHHLELETEILEEYVLIVIKPIRTVSLKNKLNILLQSKYPYTFTVQNSYKKKRIASLRITDKKAEKITFETSIPKTKKNTKNIIKIDSLLNGITNEWLALLVLAFAGLLLVYRSNRQINKIKKLQKKLEVYQEKVKNQVDNMGEQYE